MQSSAIERSDFFGSSPQRAKKFEMRRGVRSRPAMCGIVLSFVLSGCHVFEPSPRARFVGLPYDPTVNPLMVVTAERNEVLHCMGSSLGEGNKVVNFEESSLTTNCG
jgi:hypothetical protein